VENWLDQTLRHAELLELPGVVKDPRGNKNASFTYGIDKETLTK